MKVGVLTTVVFIVFLAPLATASTLGLDLTGGMVQGGSGSSSFSLGWEFTVNSTIIVDGLAYWNAPMTQSHLVGIFNDSTQALLVSATVTTSDPTIGTGNWYVQSITPFTLGPGTYDIIGVSGSDKYAFGATTTTLIPQISFVESKYNTNNPTSSLLFPNSTFGPSPQGWFGPSFTIQTTSGVPEPGTFLLLGGSLLALAALRRRRA